jgi:arginyl-tRNA synthetase
VTPRERIAAAVSAALEKAGLPETDPLVMPSAQADYQANFAMALAKLLGKPPREVAQAVVDALDDDAIERAEVAGPGFVNFTVTGAALAGWATEALAGSPEPEPRDPKTVVIDYSAPNVAKELHVGHLRSTVIGDALARTLEFAGHTVDRQNHLGDWGTQFGMLVEHMVETGHEQVTGFEELGNLYRAAQDHYQSDPGFAVRARERVVALQAHEPRTTELWQRLVDVSVAHMDEAYATLDVTLTDADIRGESFYNDMLAGTVDELVATGVAVVSEGALCAFPPGFTGREGDPLPVIIRKRDGGYNYSTSDLATVRYRVDKLNVDRMIYVVGAQQALHFQMIFAVARMAGWLPERVRAEHAHIGNVLGSDGKIFRTRSGKSIKLSALLDEAVERAGAAFDEVPHEEAFDEETRRQVVDAVGIGAVKYADLSVARDSEYVFDFDRMISFRGNTGPYLQYATARIQSIFRKGGLAPEDATGPIAIGHEAERALALHLLGFGAALVAAGEAAEPHRLCAYLFDLASAYTTFYENCPVLKAPDEATKASRLALCALTLRTLRKGLELLGVRTPERM